MNLPPGLSINSSTGLISGTVNYSAAEDFGGNYNPTIIVANNQGGSTPHHFGWTINGTVQTPVLTNPGNQTDVAGDNVSLQFNATQPQRDQLLYDASNLPPGLSIDSHTGTDLRHHRPQLHPQHALCRYRYRHRPNADRQPDLQLDRHAHHIAPTLDSPGDQSNSVGDNVSVQLSATAADSGTLTLSANGLPPGLSIDPTAGVISGTLTNTAASSTPYNVTVTVSEGSNSSSQTFNWSVSPVALERSGRSEQPGGRYRVAASDRHDASNGTLSYSADGLPPGLTIDATTGLISGIIAAGDSSGGPYVATVTAADGTYSASQTFNWT